MFMKMCISNIYISSISKGFRLCIFVEYARSKMSKMLMKKGNTEHAHLQGEK